MTQTLTLSEQLRTERHLMGVAIALGARNIDGWSQQEEALTKNLPAVDSGLVQDISQRILSGHDPLGEAFCLLRTPEERRTQGATYTPRLIVDAMLGWALDYKIPKRIVDPGLGSGRFLVAAGRRFPTAQLIGSEIDPVAAVVARGHLSAAGLANRTSVRLGDYRNLVVPPIEGPTLFVGNPPYVRHHLISSEWKSWLTDKAKSLKHSASQLSGLHVHFMLATALNARPGDFGCYITAAEWLDVNYGKLVRDLFLSELGGSKITVIEPEALPFPDAAATGAITCFAAHTKPKKISLRRVNSLKELHRLSGGDIVHRERFETETRWSHLTRRATKIPSGYIELGELCRVHRGQVTGANKMWIHGAHSQEVPDSVLFSAVTRAKELFNAGWVLKDTENLKKIIDLPVDLDQLSVEDKKQVIKFLAKARAQGIHKGYVAQNRKAWWSVGLSSPAPILATYMARRPPAFVVNEGGARHINIAHGLYPRESLSRSILHALANYLSRSTTTASGRTYAGGLTKFEPREMERLIVPGPDLLAARV
ncbi:MAG: class I SAM-dependent methyltransferase [Elusimicrobia bacterium]|nr:class I SAM-dependent methyltransferase [Elusimicrobiota bacterium]